MSCMTPILRRPRTAFSRAGALAAALAFAACAGSWDREIAETRAGLMGKNGRQLRECLGVPTDFDQRGDVELLTFRFDYTEQREILPPITSSRPGMRIPDPRPVDPGYCQLDFELARTGGTTVTAKGRDSHGLRADSACLLRAQPCL